MDSPLAPPDPRNLVERLIYRKATQRDVMELNARVNLVHAPNALRHHHNQRKLTTTTETIVVVVNKNYKCIDWLVYYLENTSHVTFETTLPLPLFTLEKLNTFTWLLYGFDTQKAKPIFV
jgi:hypothetical protein